jgi:hypothetical protein
MFILINYSYNQHFFLKCVFRLLISIHKGQHQAITEPVIWKT